MKCLVTKLDVALGDNLPILEEKNLVWTDGYESKNPNVPAGKYDVIITNGLTNPVNINISGVSGKEYYGASIEANSTRKVRIVTPETINNVRFATGTVSFVTAL